MSKIKQSAGRPKLAKQDSLNLRALRTLDSEWQLYQRAATIKGLTVSAWLRGIATRAANKIVKQ